MQRNVLDGFTKEQEELLRSRRRTRPDNSPADKWREMYMLLFPGDDIDSIPSPCKTNSAERDIGFEVKLTIPRLRTHR